MSEKAKKPTLIFGRFDNNVIFALIFIYKNALLKI